MGSWKMCGFEDYVFQGYGCGKWVCSYEFVNFLF